MQHVATLWNQSRRSYLTGKGEKVLYCRKTGGSTVRERTGSRAYIMPVNASGYLGWSRYWARYAHYLWALFRWNLAPLVASVGPIGAKRWREATFVAPKQAWSGFVYVSFISTFIGCQWLAETQSRLLSGCLPRKLPATRFFYNCGHKLCFVINKRPHFLFLISKTVINDYVINDNNVFIRHQKLKTKRRTAQSLTECKLYKSGVIW